MPQQIPEGCIPVQNRLNRLVTELGILRQSLVEADPSDKPRYQLLVGAKEREVSQARSSLTHCIANPPIVIPPPPPPPRDTVSGIPDVCVIDYRKVEKVTVEFNRLQAAYNEEQEPSQKQRFFQELGKKGIELRNAKISFNSCMNLNAEPLFHPAPKTLIPPLNTDNSVIPVKKVIKWDFLQKKFDELLNLRTDEPLFKLRLHHRYGAANDDQPESRLFIHQLENQFVNGQTIVGYKELSDTNLEKLSSGFYFNDVNSKSITVSVNPTAPEPITIKIDFETVGPEEILNVLPGLNMDVKKFTVSIKLNLDRRTYEGTQRGYLNYLSWLDQFYGIVDEEKLIDGLHKYITVNFETTQAHDFGGAFRRRLLLKIYTKLRDPNIQAKFVSMGSTWLLGQNGQFNIISLDKSDPSNFTINYEVSKGLLDPFPEAVHRGAGWPFLGNKTPDPSIDFSHPATMQNIKHVVVLMMENRSFDHMLGYLSLPVAAGGAGRKDVKGLTGNETNPYNGVNYPVYPIPAGETQFGPDPSHGYEPIYHQINSEVDAAENPIPGKGKMNGFVKSFAADANAGIRAPKVMGYHTAVNVPVYDALVRDFAFSDHYFASHPGSTFCNRYYELTGRLNLASGLNPAIPFGSWELNNSKPLTPVFTKNIFDYLTEYHAKVDSNVTWKYYEHGYSFIRFFSNYTFDGTKVVSVNDPNVGFFADAKNGTLPSVSYIDPKYTEFPPNSNCDGPPADIKSGQEFVRKVVEAVVTSPQYVNTLLVITYDEHGGFYDHVPPPPSLPYLDESATPASAQFPVKTYGVRIPTFFVSPFVKAGSVVGHGPDASGQTLYFDHTSVLKTIARKFMSKNPPYMGKRYAAAKDFSLVFNSVLRRPLFLPFVGHRIVYDPKPMKLYVNPASGLSASTLAEANDAARFAFEQAGDCIYIRTMESNRYLTVDVPSGSTAVPPQGFSIKQDVKYESGQLMSDPNRFKHQLWKFKALDATESGKKLFTITNAFFPNVVLRPADMINAAAPVILAAKTAGPANMWRVEVSILK
ncbi:MAG: hypothetical protein H7Y31_08400 [Chitinophagaceae bacterium]|nr:hypothetical protein [Chitinophagaceae bacterium]